MGAFLAALWIATFGQSGCATGPGTAEGNLGTAGLFMQIKEIPEGETLITADGFQITLEEFLIFFSGVSLVNRFFTQDFSDPFTAELFEDEAVEILDLEDVPGVDYEGLNLTLDSALIQGGAQNNGDVCRFVLQLNSFGQNIEVNMGDQVITVQKDDEAVIPILFDQLGFFTALTLGPTCTGGVEIDLVPTEEALNLFLQSFELADLPEEGTGDTGGHTH